MSAVTADKHGVEAVCRRCFTIFVFRGAKPCSEHNQVCRSSRSSGCASACESLRTAALFRRNIYKTRPAGREINRSHDADPPQQQNFGPSRVPWNMFGTDGSSKWSRSECASMKPSKLSRAASRGEEPPGEWSECGTTKPTWRAHYSQATGLLFRRHVAQHPHLPLKPLLLELELQGGMRVHKLRSVHTPQMC